MNKEDLDLYFKINNQLDFLEEKIKQRSYVVAEKLGMLDPEYKNSDTVCTNVGETETLLFVEDKYGDTIEDIVIPTEVFLSDEAIDEFMKQKETKEKENEKQQLEKEKEERRLKYEELKREFEI